MGFFDGDFLPDIGKGLRSFNRAFNRGVEATGLFESSEDLFLNLATLGTVGTNKEGEINKGFIVQPIDEVIGEVSGRNARRAELGAQKDRFAEETARREELEAEVRLDNKNADILASNAAPGRRSEQRTQNAGGGDVRKSSKSGQGFQLGEQRDFLGL